MNSAWVVCVKAGVGWVGRGVTKGLGGVYGVLVHGQLVVDVGRLLRGKRKNKRMFHYMTNVGILYLFENKSLINFRQKKVLGLASLLTYFISVKLWPKMSF